MYSSLKTLPNDRLTSQQRCFTGAANLGKFEPSVKVNAESRFMTLPRNKDDDQRTEKKSLAGGK